MSNTVYVLSFEYPYQIDIMRRFAPEGIEVEWVDSSLPLEKQKEVLKNAVAVISYPSLFPVELAEACPNLKLVQAVTAGTDKIDIATLNKMGIQVANHGGGNAAAVAEHAIALMVGVYRMLYVQMKTVKEDRIWAGDLRNTCFEHAHELTTKTVGIVGLGRIGQRVARRLLGWECKIIYTDVEYFDPVLEDALNVTRVPLDELLQTSDVVTLHVPLNRETDAMMNDRTFELMKPRSVLINTCRGPVVDEAALIRALQSGKLLGAGLDVVEEEPTPVDNPLLDMENVLITPHLAGMAQESFAKGRAFGVQNAARVMRGERAQSVVDPV